MKKKLNLKWVNETIGEDYKNWKKGDVVKIQAQTGTGKTYSIIGSKTTKGLVDRMESYERLIYICNRTELKRQIKKDLLEKFNLEVPYIKDDKGNFTLDDFGEKILDVEVLDKITTVENIVITSYHAISHGQLDNIYCNSKNDLSDFDYIVADECHFFMTDSGFNNKSYLALEELICTRHSRAIKIFISATMDEVERVIEVQVEKHRESSFGTYGNFQVHNYSTGIDYSYLDVNYFKNIKDIIQIIKNDKSDNKWIIFVTSKSKGEYINEQLTEAKIISTFIHATSENDEKKRITAEYKFNSKVLVSTKCLDNGINIKDKKVKNIVIMTYDKTTFIQELGRIRFHIYNAPTINLYIPMLNKKVFVGKIEKSYQPRIDDMELFWKDENAFQRKYNNDLTKIYGDVFYLDSDNKWKVNLTGMSRVYSDRYFAYTMIDGFETYDKFTYVKEQLSWLNLLDTFNENKLIEEVVDEEEIQTLEKWLEENVGKRLYSDEQQKLSDLIIKKLTTIANNVDYRTKKLKASTIENILRVQLELPYAVSKSKIEDKMIDGKRVAKRYIVITKII